MHGAQAQGELRVHGAPRNDQTHVWDTGVGAIGLPRHLALELDVVHGVEEAREGLLLVRVHVPHVLHFVQRPVWRARMHSGDSGGDASLTGSLK